MQNMPFSAIRLFGYSVCLSFWRPDQSRPSPSLVELRTRYSYFSFQPAFCALLFLAASSPSSSPCQGNGWRRVRRRDCLIPIVIHKGMRLIHLLFVHVFCLLFWPMHWKIKLWPRYAIANDIMRPTNSTYNKHNCLWRQFFGFLNGLTKSSLGVDLCCRLAEIIK